MQLFWSILCSLATPSQTWRIKTESLTVNVFINLLKEKITALKAIHLVNVQYNLLQNTVSNLDH